MMHGDAQPHRPAKALAIVGFALSFFIVVNIAGFIVSLVAIAQSRRAGRVERLAVAGAVIGGLGSLISLAAVVALVILASDAVSTCFELGEGTHIIDGSRYKCTGQWLRTSP